MSHSHDHDPHDSAKPSIGKLAFRLVLAALIVGLLVAYSMSFQVPEGYDAVVTRFGDPVGSVHEAGLWWKWPWPIERAHPIDMRRRHFNTPYTATFTQDRKNVVLLTYVTWRVEDPLLFLQSLGTRKAAELKLERQVAAKKSDCLGRYPLSALVSTNVEEIKTEAIEKEMLTDVAKDLENFGVRVEQVGIKRIAYPEENTEAVFEQMRAERKAEADTLRAEGQNLADTTRLDAMVESAQKYTTAVQNAATIEAQAQSEAAQTLAKVRKLDPVFYDYWRKLLAIRKIGQKAWILLRTDQGPFDVLTNPPPPPRTEPPPSQSAAETTAADQPALSATEKKATP